MGILENEVKKIKMKSQENAIKNIYLKVNNKKNKTKNNRKNRNIK